MTEQNHNQLHELLAAYPQHRVKLLDELRRYRRGRQIRVFFSGLFWGIASFAALFLLFLLVERTALQSELIRRLAFLAVAGSIGYWLREALYAFLFPPTEQLVAAEIEQIIGSFDSALTSAAEFAQPGHQDPGTSSALRKLTVVTAEKKLTPTHATTTLRHFSRKRSFFAMVALLLVIGAWYAISPAEIEIEAIRLLKPFARIAPYTSLEFLIRPGEKLVARGEEVQIIAIPNQPLKREPVLTLFPK